MSEIMPSEIRGRALALSACLSWVIPAASFLLLDVLDLLAVFHAIPYLNTAVVCAVINAGAAVFVYCLVAEGKQQPLSHTSSGPVLSS